MQQISHIIHGQDDGEYYFSGSGDFWETLYTSGATTLKENGHRNSGRSFTSDGIPLDFFDFLFLFKLVCACD